MSLDHALVTALVPGEPCEDDPPCIMHEVDAEEVLAALEVAGYAVVKALPEPPAPPEDCCANEEWRGRLCAYHQGFEDGWEALREAVEG